MPEAVAPAIGEVGRHGAPLRETIARARREIPFYAELHRSTASLDLHALPSCSKADLGRFGRLPLSARPLSDMYRVSATSGTTGPRLLVGFTERDWQAVRDQYRWLAACIGIRATDALLNTHGGGLWIGASSLDELAHAGGAGAVACGPTGPAQVIEWLRDLPVTLISATPSYMRLLAETAAQTGDDLAGLGLRMGLLGGEGSSGSLKRSVCEAFGPGFRWQELYGATETGGPILAFAPPDDPFGGRLNFNTDYFGTAAYRRGRARRARRNRRNHPEHALSRRLGAASVPHPRSGRFAPPGARRVGLATGNHAHRARR